MQQKKRHGFAVVALPHEVLPEQAQHLNLTRPAIAHAACCFPFHNIYIYIVHYYRKVIYIPSGKKKTFFLCFGNASVTITTSSSNMF
ncbi:hypothetical protein SLT67_15655 [Paenibacillus illinoisensis]|uniref:hypothetical protein n=1 Tax=Paenibacillus illinoisensis TaxID=59845 RepID=UPI003CE87330